MKFDIYKKLNLSFLGDGWENCYITYGAISVKEAKGFLNIKDEADLVNMGIELLTEKFTSGKGLSGGKEVDLKKEHIGDLPIQVISKSIELLTGDVDKKKE